MLLEELDNVAGMLAKMSPQQRQQFAAMHHNDPYLLSLTKFVNDTVRTNAQALKNQQLMGQPPMPPVNQQAIQGMAPPQAQAMLPEDQGIAQLPTRDAMTQEAAVGGIVGNDYDMAVGYADGGMVERYKDRGLVGPYPTQGSQFDIQGYTPGATPLVPGQEGAPENTPLFQRLLGSMRETGRRYQLAEARKRIEMGVGTPADYRIVREAAETGVDIGPPATAAGASASVATAAGKKGAPTAAPAPAPAPVSAAAPAVDTEERRSPPPVFGAPTALPKEKTPEALAQSYNKAMGAVDAKDPAAAERQKLQEEIVAAARAREAEFDKDVAARGDRFKAREERFAAREGRLREEAKTNEGLALLSAAAAVLTPGGLAAGLGKAAQVAIPQYQEGLSKLRAAQERIEEGRDRLDELRQNYDDLTARERRQLRDGINTAGIEARKLGIEGIMATQGVKEKQANTIFTAMMQQEQERIQQAGAMQRTQVAGQYSVEAARQRGANADGMDYRLFSTAERVKKAIDDRIKADVVMRNDPAAAERFRQEQYRAYVQTTPQLAQYLGVTGGGAAPSQSDPLGILGSKP